MELLLLHLPTAGEEEQEHFWEKEGKAAPEAQGQPLHVMTLILCFFC